MRLLVLTTETSHHTFFVRELAVLYPALRVVCETSGITPPFEVHHPFEGEREQYERMTWFNSRQLSLKDVAETLTFENVNRPEAVACIAEFRPDVTVVFGTRRLSRPVISAARQRVMNLHGGNPEHYRGLDSHLWAIYHSDYVNLVTTLHVLNEKLDDGAIIAERAIPLSRGMRLHELRRHNTECALRLTREALDHIAASSTPVAVARMQRQIGRYYSFMPAALKDLCVSKFERYCANLP